MLPSFRSAPPSPLKRDDGRVQKFRIVGEDELNPSKGKISYASPVAQALMEKSVGDESRDGRRGRG